MSRIVIECKACGTRIVTGDMAEVKAWGDGHDAKCVGRPGPVLGEPDQLAGTVIGWAVVEKVERADGWQPNGDADCVVTVEVNRDIAETTARWLTPKDDRTAFTVAALVEPGD